MKFIAYYDSPLGKITLAGDEAGLCGLWIRGREILRARSCGKRRRRQILHARYCGKNRYRCERGLLRERSCAKGEKRCG